MFFVSNHNIGFENIRDVIRAYPDWELKVLSGAQLRIEREATITQDATLAEFVERDRKNPQSTRYDNLDEAIRDSGHWVLLPLSL